MERQIRTLFAGGVLAFAAALATGPPVSAAQDYPPGLFENSPVVPSGPPDATDPSGPPDAAFPFGPQPDADGSLEDYCAGVASRIFRSPVEVRQAHARCDPVRRAAPMSPPAEDQSYEWSEQYRRTRHVICAACHMVRIVIRPAAHEVIVTDALNRRLV